MFLLKNILLLSNVEMYLEAYKSKHPLNYSLALSRRLLFYFLTYY